MRGVASEVDHVVQVCPSIVVNVGEVASGSKVQCSFYRMRKDSIVPDLLRVICAHSGNPHNNR